MTKRRIWGDREPISGSDLTDIGQYTESAVGDLAIGFGPGVLQGFTVNQTATPSASVAVSGGKLLVTDPTVSRPRLVDLAATTTLSFSGKSVGSYAIVVTAQEAGEDQRTIVPPPPGHPFYEAGAQPYQLSTVLHWIAGLSLQAMPYTPSGAQVILATVNWSGAGAVNTDIQMVLGAPTPLLGDSGVLPVKIDRSIAGAGLNRSPLGVLNVATDNVSIVMNLNQLRVRDNGVSDPMIGARQLQPNVLPADPLTSSTLSGVLGWLAQQIIQVTGQGAWNTTPDTTLAALNSSVSRKGNNESISGSWTFTAPVMVAAPIAAGHATTKAYVDSALGTLGGNATGSLGTHRTAGVLDHPDGSVTDAKLGGRVVAQADTLPGSLTQQTDLSGTLAWIGRTLRDIKGTGRWFDPANSNLTDLSTRVISLEGDRRQVDDGSITDNKIGARTVQDTLVPAGNTAQLTALLSGLASRIKALSGKDNWTLSPDTTVAELNVNVTRRGANEAVAGSWNFIASPAVPTPTNPTHAVNKSYVDTLAGNSATGAASAAVNAHKTASLLDHPDGSVSGAKLALTAVQDRLGYVPLSPSGGDIANLRTTGGLGSFKLSAGSTDAAWMELYARSGNAAPRSGTLGYLAAGAVALTLQNEVPGGDLALIAGSGGRVLVTGNTRVQGTLEAVGEVVARNGYGDSINLGGDAAGNDYELRLGNASRALTVWSGAGSIAVNVLGSLSAQLLSVSGAVTLAATLSVGGALSVGGLGIQALNGVLRTGPLTSDLLRVGVNEVWHAGNLDPASITAAGNITAASLLTKLLTVDGAGSKLDADLLGGRASSGYALVVHGHTKSQITDFAHSHVITDLPIAASGEINSAKLVASDDARLGDARSPRAHTHGKAEITDFAHSHPVSDVAGLQAALDSKALSNHTHPVSAIAGLQGALDSKSNIGHRHGWSELDGIPTTLAGHGITDGNVYDLSGFNPGRPVAGEVVMAVVAARPTSLQASAPGIARALVAATSTVVLSVLNEGGTQIGSVTFNGGSAMGVIALVSDQTLQTGQLLVIRAPGTRDATLSDVAITLRGRY